MTIVDSIADGVTVEACGKRLTVEHVLTGNNYLVVLLSIETLPDIRKGTDTWEIVHLATEGGECLHCCMALESTGISFFAFHYKGDYNDAIFRITDCDGVYNIPLSDFSNNKKIIMLPQKEKMVEDDIPDSSVFTISGTEYMYCVVADSSIFLYPRELVTAKDGIDYEKVESIGFYALKSLIEDFEDEAERLAKYLPEKRPDTTWIDELAVGDSDYDDVIYDRLHESFLDDESITIVLGSYFGNLRSLRTRSWCDGSQKETCYILEDDDGTFHLIRIQTSP